VQIDGYSLPGNSDGRLENMNSNKLDLWINGAYLAHLPPVCQTSGQFGGKVNVFPTSFS
jgi:hypothetical protein